jgi:hypothetical protein
MGRGKKKKKKKKERRQEKKKISIWTTFSTLRSLFDSTLKKVLRKTLIYIAHYILMFYVGLLFCLIY